MPSVCFYFQVHQPYRIKKYRVFDIGKKHKYFNDVSKSSLNNQWILHRVATKCYLPTNRLLLQLLKKYPGFKISFSFSGVFLEQTKKYEPEVLKSFQKLVSTGQVEILSETYYHSLAFLFSEQEFINQIKAHSELIKKTFKVTPTVFRNTELIFRNDIAQVIEKLGFQAALAEGAERVLQTRTPNVLYKAAATKNLKMLLKNFQLSDDIAFRFTNHDWEGYPMTAGKFSSWLNANKKADVLNLFMDYETFGEHQNKSSGIFRFLRELPKEVLKYPHLDFITPNEAIERYQPKDTIDFPDYVSWADSERDLSAWRSNPLQSDALEKIYSLEKSILESKDKKLIEDWKRLQISDHFYYMCTKYFIDGDIHKYFSPYESPYEAFINFMNVVQDLKLRLGKKETNKK